MCFSGTNQVVPGCLITRHMWHQSQRRSVPESSFTKATQPMRMYITLPKKKLSTVKTQAMIQSYITECDQRESERESYGEQRRRDEVEGT